MRRRLATLLAVGALLTGMLATSGVVLAANPAGNLDQCANGSLAAPNVPACNPNEWVNGNLGASKAHYVEGDTVPYRMRFTNLTIAPNHKVIIEWDTTKSGKHALDYLRTYNQTVTTANPCAGVSSCGGTPSTLGIPKDPQVIAVPPAGAVGGQPDGVFTLWGGTITGISAYSYANGPGFVGDKSARLEITFTASVGNPVLAWGGHIATRAAWGAGNSAVAIPGSPYHMRLVGLDGVGGNQDRSLSADAVIFPGSITIVKDATPNGPTSFGFTASPAPPLANFSLVDDGTTANTKPFPNIMTFQTYTVTESSIPANWGFDSVSCSATSGNGGTYTNPSGSTVNINMNEGENWTCTYLDSRRQGTLTVIKHVVNDNGGGAAASAWSLHVQSGTTDVTGSPQAGSESGTSYTLNGGTYNVNETGGPNGYTFTGYSGDCDSSGNVTVVAGQTKTCTLTNNDNAAGLTLVKHVVNDNGGDADASAWTLHAGANQVAGSEAGIVATTSAGTYALSETGGPATGYSLTSIVCTGSTASVTSVTLAVGESKTCTFTNDDAPASLTLVKHVVNDNGGGAVASAWTLYAGTHSVAGSEAGIVATTSAGTYALSETGGATGYTNTSIVCTGSTTSVTSVTLAVGESKTCTFTNDDDAPSLVLVKNVVNDNGGDADAGDWTLYADLLSVVGSEAGAEVTDQAGSYDLTESAGPDGYTNTSITCDNATGEVNSATVALGETVTCTFVNDDSKATPDISTDVDAQIRDNVAITGRGTPSGTVDFHLFSDATCTTEVDSDLGVALGGSSEATSKWIDISSSDTYYWRVDYSGDDNNAARTGDCGEAITVTSESFDPVAPLAAFVGFGLPMLLWTLRRRRNDED